MELNGLSPSTNVVVTSDHGMTATGLGSSKTSSKITEYTDAGNLERVVGSGPFANVKVKEGVDARQVASELQVSH